MPNPFAVQDVEDPVGPDVEAFAKKLEVTADPTTDENSTAWVAIATSSDDGLDGAWSSRWRRIPRRNVPVAIQKYHLDWLQEPISIGECSEFAAQTRRALQPKD